MRFRNLLLESPIGEWTVLGYAGKNQHNQSSWNCRCRCGTVRKVVGSTLTTGASRSCGCSQNKVVSLLKPGLEVGQLKVLSIFSPGSNGVATYFLCRCACGVEKPIAGNALLNGSTVSCGCHRSRRMINRHRTLRISRGNSPDQLLSSLGHQLQQSCSETRRRVRERDQFTCQLCGKKGGRINAHHTQRIADHPEFANDETTMLTLCAGKGSCHWRAHSNSPGGPLDSVIQAQLQEILRKKYEKAP